MAIDKILVKILKKLRYRRFKISVYTNDQLIQPISNNNFHIKIANKNILSNYSLINSQLKQGICYYIETNNELAHFSWLFKNNLLARQLKLKNYWTIGNCETYEKFKGNGMYGIVVSKIITDFPKQKFALFIEPDNIPSINGVTKIGLKCSGTYEIFRFLGVSIKITKINA